MQEAALLVIDVQKTFDEPAWGQRNNLNAETNIAAPIKYWRSKNSTVIHIHHSAEMLESSFHPNNVGHQPKMEALPLHNEVVFNKSVNSVFIGTQLENHLHEHKIEQLVIVGLTTDYCISTSVRMAANLGFRVTLISDATVTFSRKYDGVEYTAEQIQAINLASLNHEFCQNTTTAAALCP